MVVPLGLRKDVLPWEHYSILAGSQLDNGCTIQWVDIITDGNLQMMFMKEMNNVDRANEAQPWPKAFENILVLTSRSTGACGHGHIGTSFWDRRCRPVQNQSYWQIFEIYESNYHCKDTSYRNCNCIIWPFDVVVFIPTALAEIYPSTFSKKALSDAMHFACSERTIYDHEATPC